MILCMYLHKQLKKKEQAALENFRTFNKIFHIKFLPNLLNEGVRVGFRVLIMGNIYTMCVIISWRSVRNDHSIG